MEIGFTIFCSSITAVWFFKVYSQGVKTERKLNCNRALRGCRKICETGNIQPVKWSGGTIGPTRDEAKRNSAPEVQLTPGVPDTEVQLLFLHMCVALWKFISRADRKFILCPGGALHMYVALRLFILHLRNALLQFNFLSVFTSCE